VRDGSDVTLIATGGILSNVMQAAERLALQGIQAKVVSMHTLKPLDSEAVLAAIQQTKAIITVEEHSVIGGLGGTVAEVLAESGNSHITFRRICIKDGFCQQVGSQDYLRGICGLSVDSIIEIVRALSEAAQK
jgi:transketolase